MQNSEIQSVKKRFGIIGNDATLNHAIDTAIQVAPIDLSVLITGESGVGKERFPQILHAYSHRKHGSYIAVNCGAIPEGTIDSELFGHQKGAFTGATSDRKGYFEVADGGTIFLDEVGELPLSTQVRLLRVLETGEFIRVGSSKPIKTDVRVVAATNLNIPKAIKEGKFREDLYYRLNAIPIQIPPLRQRKEDIYLLFRKFALDFSEKYSMPPIRLDETAKKMLMSYYWKGNVRQLKNITEQISVIEQQREITEDILVNYLPQDEKEVLPALITKEQEKTFNNEREILYQVLFDMKRDMNELRKIVSDLQTDKGNKTYDYDVKITPNDNGLMPIKPISLEDIYQSKKDIRPQNKEYEHIHDVEDYEPEVTTEIKSLAEMEKEMIIRALEKYNGKRKPASEELEISERTLYRKIKEYEIEIK
ncbi:MAG: sigma-54-dependent Fis family transcriptional regulator [Paludibacter sp.]|nr:MAG: sigma-54-dependent Fis family transcriptional regulator [Paludibacter sp.]